MSAKNIVLVNPNQGRSSSRPRQQGEEIKWQPPVRSKALQIVDWVISIGAACTVLWTLGLTALYWVLPENSLFWPCFMTWLTVLVFLGIAGPRRVEVPFDHWVIIKRFGQPQRMKDWKEIDELIDLFVRDTAPKGDWWQE